MKSNQNSTFNIDEKYLTLFDSENEVHQLGWGSIHSQNKRFEILLQIRDYEQQDSILDVGCGYGDLSRMVPNYEGIDLRLSAIEKARSKFPEKSFSHGDIFTTTRTYDWIVASGIFCFSHNWKSTTLHTLSRMYDLCNKGVSVNFLSSRSKGRRIKGMKYAKIQEILGMIPQGCSDFTIRHDYLDNDFTMYLYK